jgi:dUTP pyrophosphatase
LVLLFNHSNEPYGFMAGERIAQARITASPRVTFRVVEQLSATDRGAGGFGHTGR